jgi:lipopolysaccharide transport system permease protein
MTLEAVDAEKQASAWVENRPTSSRIVLPEVGELWRFRELAAVLAWRDVQLRYKQTFFGAAWAIVQPLVGSLIFTVIFGHLAGLSSGGVPYEVFAFAGLTVWSFFAGGIGRASGGLVENEAFITKTYFPRLLVPIASVLPGLVDLGISLVVLAVIMAIAGVAPGAAVLLVPVWIVLLTLFTCGVGAFFSAANVAYRDVGYVLPFILQVGLFLSPVAYASSLADGRWSILYDLNPMTGLLDAFRWSALGAAAPGTGALASLGVGIVLAAGGILYFKKVERRFADVI